jgi:CRP-like cAMP-binding protein
MEQARREQSPIMDTALSGLFRDGGSTVPKTDRTLNEIERMLFLRRVPLFSQLAPEDLQRVAWSATERLYPAGEALVLEGDVGDELVVIVDGTVRIVQGAGPDARTVRTYGPGDHIGELAVLTDRPRVATVLADDGAVRGLVIEGAALRAILTERPEAAMAMLTTLAERIGAQ